MNSLPTLERGQLKDDDLGKLHREEWGVINNYKALEFDRLRKLEKAAENEKKKQFKEQLDRQMSQRLGSEQFEKQQDRMYQEYVIKKSEQEKNREERERMEKILKRQQIEQENQERLEHLLNSRPLNNDPQSGIEIGLKSELEHKRIEQRHRREMLDTLDKQIKIKQKEKQSEKMQRQQADQQNLKYQFEQFDKRHYKFKGHSQNPQVYQYYTDLESERIRKERELNHRLVEEAAIQKRKEEDERQQSKEKERKNLTHQMKNTLDLQIQHRSQQMKEQNTYNPQDNSFRVIGSIFQQRPSPYDKRAYSEYLKRQAEQQNRKKLGEKFMNEEEYRINMNQLNRAVTGQYAHDTYIDRTVGAIGDNKKVNGSLIHETVEDEDKNAIKQRIQGLKYRMRSPYAQHNSSGII